MNQIISKITEGQLKKDLPEFSSGDTVKVQLKITEGNKERLQDFVGIVIRRRGAGIQKTYTERSVSFNVGMEKVFPLHSPSIEKIEVQRRAKVRRARLYYLRQLSGKAARIKEDRQR
ncbi:50S ribosomal protein L19 [Candidatus Desantisbacteria bacterium]|nr:50S ribosomal protein L19 [Candidatus Desantisbacteria bacterium]